MSDALAVGYGTFEGRDEISAVSDVAAQLRGLLSNLRRATDDAQTMSGRESLFDRRLRAVLGELIVDDDQHAVSTAAVHSAMRLIRSLPNDVPIPEVAVDPDGEISLNWMPARARVFSISVGDSDRMAYALLDGSDRAHGVFRFAGTIPAVQLLQLRSLNVDTHAAVRAA